MGLDQSGSPVFCVVMSKSGQWDVNETGFEKSLASFDDPEDALEYAHDLAELKEGSVVKMYDDRGEELTSD